MAVPTTFIPPLSDTDRNLYDRMSGKYAYELERSMQQTKAHMVADIYKSAYPPAFDPNNEPALNVSLETLRDTWAAAFGSKWVDATSLANDKVWDIGVQVLAHAGALQDLSSLYKTSGHSIWLRLKE